MRPAASHHYGSAAPHSSPGADAAARTLPPPPLILCRPPLPTAHLRYLAGDTPESSALTDVFPEVAALRDIVFFSKLLLVPVAEALPDMSPWKLQDSSLAWSFNAAERKLVVSGFGQSLDPSVGSAALAAAEAAKGSFSYRNAVFGILFGSNVKPRCPPSGANPSVLAGQVVDTEEDVLHLKKLPDFDGTLRGSDAELLLSYLTAPYLRIPLLLRFFATPERISALGSRELQSVLHSSVFEPGARLPPGPRLPPVTAPDMDRARLATSCGLLFNELACSPAAAAGCVARLLELALDLDLGKWSDVSSRIVLSAVRLAVRVESFMLFLLRHSEWADAHKAIPEFTLDLHTQSADGSADGAGALAAPPPEVPSLWGQASWATVVRGLELAPGAADALLAGHARLRGLLEGRASMIMERYLSQALVEKQELRACTLHCHLALFHGSAGELLPGGLTKKAVTAVLCAQAFLAAHYEFEDPTGGPSTGGRKSARPPPTLVSDESPLGLPDMEVFGLFQKNRVRVLEWLSRSKRERDEVFESVVHCITLSSEQLSGAMDQAGARSWRELTGPGGAGRFVPDEGGSAAGSAAAAADTEEVDSVGVARVGESYEQWLHRVGTASAQIEVNLNTGEVTVKRHHMMPLPRTIAGVPDVVAALGPLDAESCAEARRLLPTHHHPLPAAAAAAAAAAYAACRESAHRKKRCGMPLSR